tara:strand:- start:964 stop:1167 length:204 start_codon:yes stop_codon:yes gene_type:complete
MATLTTKQRKRMKASSFALPGKRAYPINDIAHCRAALRLLHNATPAEQKIIRRKVYKKCPSLKPKKK